MIIFMVMNLTINYMEEWYDTIKGGKGDDTRWGFWN